MTPPTAKAVAATLLPILHHLEITDSTKKLKLEGKYLKDDDRLLEALCLSLEPTHRSKLLVEYVGLLNDRVFGRELREELKQSLISRNRADDEVDLTQVYFNDVISCPLSDLKLIINVKTPKQSLLFDPKHDAFHPYDYDLVNKRVGQLLGKQAGSWHMSNTEDCFHVYDPTNALRMWDDKGAQRRYFNLWTEATWRESWQPDPEAKLPQELREFFEALSPCEKSRKCLKAWLRDAVFGRAEPIICFIGTPGVGKNIFVEEIAAKLVGGHNYRSAQRGFVKTQFHNNISRCRLFFLDEAALTAEGRETLKAYHNAFATIERKGVDVNDPERIHASFVLANNSRLAIKLEYTDRKFFVPELSTTPLPISLGQEKIDKLLTLLRETDWMGNVASYLFNTYKQGSSKRFPKTETFKNICIMSLPHAFRRFIDACRSQAKVSSRAFSKRGNKGFEFYELHDLIANYEAQFGEPLATLTYEDGSWTAYSKIFQGKPAEEITITKEPDL